jgi:hypothetical protein
MAKLSPTTPPPTPPPTAKLSPTGGSPAWVVGGLEDLQPPEGGGVAGAREAAACAGEANFAEKLGPQDGIDGDHGFGEEAGCGRWSRGP